MIAVFKSSEIRLLNHWYLYFFFFFLMLRRPPISPLFPSTPLSRSLIPLLLFFAFVFGMLFAVGVLRCPFRGAPARGPAAPAGGAFAGAAGSRAGAHRKGQRST